MDLLSLLQFRGLPLDKEFKVYQHVGNSIQDEIDRGNLDEVQSYHSGDVLGRGYLVSFVKEQTGGSRFLGVWRVLTEKKIPNPVGKRPISIYEFARLNEFDDLIDRLMIRWPRGRITHRWLFKPDASCAPIDIDQIRPNGFLGDFPGFDGIILPHRQLSKLVSNQTASLNWVSPLRSTRAVYLITDLETGDLYVGSATGADGLWGRWRNYAGSVHGGNKLMIDSVNKIEAFGDRLQFSVLETLSNLASREDGLRAEERWKRKLGRKAIILNGN
jgi:hypothetical protein